MNATNVERWDDLAPEDLRRMSEWMLRDIIGQAVAGEADHDMDYALWLIAVSGVCHYRTGKPYTVYPHADWRASYTACRTPGEAVTANKGATMNATTVTGKDPLAAARYAVHVAASLDDDSRFILGNQALLHPEDPNDIRAYLDLRYVIEPTLATLLGRGLVAAEDTTVAWTEQPLRPLTRFGLLVHTALDKGGDYVIEGARIEIDGHAEWDAHRAEPGHDPATCGWVACSGEPCYWPMCDRAEV